MQSQQKARRNMAHKGAQTRYQDNKLYKETATTAFSLQYFCEVMYIKTKAVFVVF